jgi:hypothetical protein
MSSIPLDLERRFEQRWAARFSGALQEHCKRQRQQHTALGKSKREARRVESVLRPPACEADGPDTQIAG